MGKFYISAPVDEIRLGEAVASCVASLQGALPDSASLRQLAAQHGLDFATMVLYQAIHANARHAAYIRSIEQQAIVTHHPPIDAKIWIIPALFHGHYPETGANAQFAADIAKNCGFQVATMPIKSLGTVSDNAAIIADTLARESAQQIWIFAVSKGSADFRAFLQGHGNTAAATCVTARIKGWINVCGLPGGAQIADYDTATAWRRLKYRAICRLLGTHYTLLRELRTDSALWATPLVLPPHFQVLNFCAIPLGAHIQTSLIGRYRALSSQGPNDGMVCCRDSILEPGLIYPVLGCDHFFRGPQINALLYRFFAWLRLQ